MKIKKIFFLINSIWELIRFFLLFLSLAVIFRLIILANPQSIYWLIISGSSQLLVPAGLLIIFFNPKKENSSLLNLIRLGKVLGIISSLLLIIIEPISTRLYIDSTKFLPLYITPVLLLLGITFFDLIFLFILLSYKETEEALPDFRETEITDSSS